MTPMSLARSCLNRFQRVRLRTQLLLVINVAIAIVMAGFIGFDYTHSVRARLHDKRIALSEEARTIKIAVQALRTSGLDAVQAYVDATCATMNAWESPGHRIEVMMGDVLIASDPAAHAHDHADLWSELISGSTGFADIRVRVGERRGPLIAATQRAALGRIGGIVVAGFVGAVMLNILLVRLVSRPLERTVRVVRDIERGRFGGTVEVSANRELSELAQDVSQMSRELARRAADRNAQLERARRLQSHLIPSRTSGDVSIAIEYHPADEVAGDFVDVIACPNGDTLVCVADVVGHGIHAAMGSAVLKALLLATDLSELSPSAMLQAINRRYCLSSLPEDFASMVLLRLSADGARAVYASAGHETGYVRCADGSCDPLSSTGLILGIDADATCEDREVSLSGGDVLVLLSDGVSEAANEGGILFGRKTVASIVGASGCADPSQLARDLVNAATRHRGRAPVLDDMTVLTVGVPACTSERRALRCATLSGT